MDPQGKWMVLHCDVDDSHVLIAENDVICDESVKVGDVVKFSYAGQKGFLHGVVKGISDDYDSLKVLQNKLNLDTKPKRESSFHADKPRRAAVRCKEKGFSCGRSSRSSSSRSAGKINNESKVSTQEVKSVQQTNTRDKASHHVKQDQKKKESRKIKPSVLAQVLKSASSSSSDESDIESFKQNCANPEASNALKVGDTSQQLQVKIPEQMIVSDFDKGATAERGKLFNSSSSDEKELPSIDQEQGNMVTDISDSDSSSSEELSAEELKLLEKLAKKKKKKDFSHLLALSSGKEMSCKGKTSSEIPAIKKIKLAENDDSFLSPSGSFENLSDIGKNGNFKLTNSESKPLPCSKVDSTSPVRKDHSNEGAPKLVTTHSSSQSLLDPDVNKSKEEAPSTSSQFKMNEDKPDYKKSYIKAQLMQLVQKKYNKKVFHGEFFRFKEGEKISQFHDVFISAEALKEAKKCTTSTALVRCLVKRVFTDEALDQCSVSGKHSPHSKDIRPALHPDGVEAILDFAKRRAEKKKWPTPMEVYLKQHMGNLLADDRMKKKLREIVETELCGD